MSQFFAQYPVEGGGGGGGVTTLNGLSGAITLAAGSNITLTPSGNTITIASTGGGGGVTTIGTIDSQTPSANGAVITGSSLVLQSASGTVPGLVNNTTQTFSGQKTFSTGLTGTLTGSASLNVLTSALGTVTEVTSSVLTLTGWTDATVGSPTIQVKQAGTSQSGFLSSTDWNTFNNKSPSGNFTTSGTGDVSWSAPSGPGPVTTSLVATTNSTLTTLSSLSLPYSQITGAPAAITALTGDGTATGPSSSALTLATVNSSPGTYTLASITVNAKGLVTSATSGTAGSGTVTSVGISAPALFTVSGSPVTTSGTLTLAYSGTALPIANGGTGQTTAAAAFTALAPSIGPDNSVLSADSASTGGVAYLRPPNIKNYISNPGFESNTTTDWSLGTVGTLTNGIPTGNPTFGSGASGNLSISIVSSGQLAGLHSLSYASSAATTQGNMLATAAMAIDSEDQAKVLTFKFYYSVPVGPTTGNFSGTSSNSFGIAVYDATNSAWLTSTANFGMTQTTGVGYVTGTCQTGITTASIRFVLYNANATSGAITLYLDDFFLGPQTAPLGAVMTDWVSYTPTLTGFGTPTNVNFSSRRVGDSLEVVGKFTSGTPAGTTASITLGFDGGNNNVTVDTTKVPATALVGSGMSGFGTTTAFNWTVLSPSSNQSLVNMGFQSSTTTGSTTAIGSALTGSNSNELIEMFFRVPIVGWSSNVQMSSDTDTRVVAAQYADTSGQAISTSAAVFKFGTQLLDTHAGYSSSTGLYTVPVTGSYRVSAVVRTAAVALTTSEGFNIAVYHNGSAYATNGVLGTGGTVPWLASISATVYCVAGDTLSIEVFNSVSTTGTTSAGVNNLSIERLSGPSVIAATESVNGRYFSSSTSITASDTTITYATKDYDTHNAYASGTLTIPVSGKYAINGKLATTDASGVHTLSVSIYQNGTQKSQNTTVGVAAATGADCLVSDIINCLAGDAITIRANDSGTTPSIVSSNVRNYISWTRVGN